MAWRFVNNDFTSAAIGAFFADNGGTRRWANVRWYDWADAFLRWRQRMGMMVHSEPIPDDVIPDDPWVPRTPEREE